MFAAALTKAPTGSVSRKSTLSGGISGQLEEGDKKFTEARALYEEGTRRVGAISDAVPLWTSLAKLEEKTGGVVRSRSVLELARLQLPKEEHLWIAAVRLEVRHKTDLIDRIMAKALTECPSSGILWSEKIATAKRTVRRSTCVSALKACENDAYVNMAAAMMFWGDLKYGKARKWFEKAVKANPDLGDAWAAYIAMETSVADSDDTIDRIRRSATQAAPCHGEHSRRRRPHGACLV